MRKNHVREQKISALIDGELSAAESEAICQHIKECRTCRDTFRHWQQLDHYLQPRERETAPPPFFRQKILAYLQQETISSSGQVRPRLQLFESGLRLTTAGLVALGILLGTLMGATLVPFLPQDRPQIDLMASLSLQDHPASSLAGVALAFLNEGESP